MRRLISVGIVFFVLCAGVAPAVGVDARPDGAADGATAPAVGAPTAQATGGAPPDPSGDPSGWENGYWYNESIDVSQDDGLSDAELDRYVARSMARVERITGREFESDVEVSTVSRAEYRNRSGEGGGGDAWNDQVWEGLFIVGEDRSSQAVLNEALGSSVAGYYSPSSGRIRIVADGTGRPVIDNATLIHELTHALQDQRYNLSDPNYTAQTQDGELAVDGLVEGEANYVETRYAQRCGERWRCVATPVDRGGSVGGGSTPNLGVLFTLLQPYSDGPAYVSRLIERGGWDAVERAFRNPPVSTEQVIHTTGERPVDIGYEDEAENGWRRFENRGVNGADTVGEASIYAMFWYQARQYGAETVDVRAFFDAPGPYDMYDYDASPSNGWANDALVPYHNGSGSNASYGYVWVTEWDSERDAREFRDAYGRILDAHGAQARGGVRVVPDGPFADAFRVVRNGTRVTVVNGPTPAAVRALRPSLAGADSGAETTDAPVPGLGPALAVVALGAFALLAALARRR